MAKEINKKQKALVTLIYFNFCECQIHNQGKWPIAYSYFIHYLLLFKKCLFIFFAGGESEWEGQREKEREKRI